MKDLKT